MIILPANTLSTGGYEVANSCRFNEADSPDLSRATGETTGATQWTFSAWIKRSTLGSLDNGGTFLGWYTSTSKRSIFGFNDDDKLYWWSDNGSGTQGDATTAAVFRDVSAWYHVVLKIDTPQASQSNRVKIYVNNVEQTLTFSGAHPAQSEANTGMYGKSIIGASYYNTGTDRHFGGYLAEVCLIDDSALSPSSFGEADEDSPNIWKPKDVSGLTFGSDGAYLDFEDSGDLDDDESGNTNDYTATNLAATDQSTDTPTNNFCTMNPLNAYYDVCTLSEGNTKYDGNSATGQYTFTPATMGFNKAKWYWEMKFGSSDTDNWGGIGITSANSTGTTNYLGGSANAYAYYGRTLSGGLGVTYTNNTQTNQGLPFEDGDIIMVAVDCDNLAIYFGKNGTWLNNSSSVTGVPTSGSSKTGAFFSITAPSSTTDGFYFPASGTYSGSQVYPQFLNFGSPAYAISSGNADANGYGNFEYTVPSGYLALCTKNLGSDGG